MQEQIFDLLLNQEDVTWKTLLYDLVKTEQMDPWDVNITLLTQKYLEAIKEIQEHDFRVSGKILLAAAFLLKMKSNHLVEHDIFNYDQLISQTDEISEEDEMGNGMSNGFHRDKTSFALIPKNPQPRNRKVSIHDLVSALQRAMATKKRILAQQRPTPFIIPKRNMDIMEAIRDTYHKIQYYTNKEQEIPLTFSKLLPPRAGRQEKVYTFIPLLHLEHQQKVETQQKGHFEEIFIRIVAKSKATE
ncbi:MAG: segregation and condensation protein A [archaeon GW2011_AR9]|nr:MAG: segregation and condensation protein A [archaeon GW2011_AR9]MBS3120988.1 segregation/condensation protein A [Candidatus Woesearchaeota archaeon]HIG93628.1 segregation/condensation protein A [Candidatus Woesearchaeota archaeon]HIH13290.1 segregation/condensation protein A [Candidatus Woesearchaeota archaeon]